MVLARRLLIRLGAYSAALYLAVVAGFGIAQADLIFVGHQLQGQEDARFAPEPGTSLVPLGDSVVALFAPALTADGRPDPEAARRPGLVYFYGNGDCVRRSLRNVETFRRLGANVLVPEYPGYGLSGGTPSEEGCARAAMAAYDHLRARPDVDARRIVSVGVSLGGAVAIDLATRRDVQGLATSSTFTSMADMAHREYPWLIIGPILRHPFASEEKMPRVRCPILLAHGTADTLVPPSMRERLAAAARAPVTRVDMVGGGHNDIFWADGGRFPAALGSFLATLPAAR